jgi:SAM-dependent methyltransferase
MTSSGIPNASLLESEYVKALSRGPTVNAYSKWMVLSPIEEYLCQFIKKGDKVLDLGCGTGRIPNILGAHFGGYVGVDCSAEMIEKAIELNPEFNFICEDLLEPSYNENNFDVVLLMNNVLDMLHPLERRIAAFRLVKDVLSPSGLMICSSHLLNIETYPGYFEEEYHGAIVNTYRSSFSHLCYEIENHGFEIKVAARDYRAEVADWVYFAASIKALGDAS